MSLRTVTVPALAAVSGLVHGFERRLPGGGSEGREQCRSRVARGLAPRGRLLLLKQVHGATVLEAPWEGAPEADAAVSTAAGFLLGIETADCLPILVVDPVRRAAAAAHAGWRGTAASVAMRAVERLVARGSRAADLVAALGPAIGPCCYEVGAELRGSFGGEGDGIFRADPAGRLFLDLRLANTRQLLRSGVPAESLHQVDECTFCHFDDYCSYRRDGKGAGRMISFVGFGCDQAPSVA